MLQFVKQYAIENDFNRVTSAIVSRESLQAFCSVFGEESLEVKRAGLFEDEITDASGVEQYTYATLSFEPGRS